MSFARWTVSLAFISVAITGCLSSHGDGAVRAVNLRSGEMRDFPDEESIPDGWGICTDDGCPTLVACEGLDETSCLAREDCEAAYADEGFAGCSTGGGGGEECAVEECGEASLAPAIICDDGSIGGNTGRCIAGADGVCGWEWRECPDPEPTECTEEECGPAPGIPSWTCADGTIGGSTGRCRRAEDGVCGWEIRDCEPVDCTEIPMCDFECPAGTHNPVDEAGCVHTCECVPDEDTGGSCGADECVAYGRPDPVCADGTPSTGICERGLDGACGWHYSCGSCETEECGPPPGADPFCGETGSAMIACERNLEGVCRWHFSCG
jgi:hypothetical protein